MHILVTGGAGYLGSVASLALLDAGHQVRILDDLLYGGQALLPLLLHSELEFMRGDLCEEATLQAALQGIDAVVHLAAIVGDPACAQRGDYAKKVNLTASLKLIELARASGVRHLVAASTCSNYGKMRDITELATEEHELRPVSLYAETKVAVEQSCLSAPPDEMNVSILRFATLYGLSPRMRFDLTVNEFVLRMIVDHRLTVYGEQFWRPYVHVQDAARAIHAVLKQPGDTGTRRIFNVGDTGENYRKADLVELIQKQIGTVNVEFVKKTEDPRDYRVSFEKIREQLGFEVTHRVPDGIREVAFAIQSGVLEPELCLKMSNTQ